MVFKGSLGRVLRDDARAILESSFSDRSLVFLNFFFFNKMVGKSSYIVPDELIFRALYFPHTREFDNLATTTFFVSRVGRWEGAASYQRFPASWARSLLLDALVTENGWDFGKVNPDYLQAHLAIHLGQVNSLRKVATNLAYFLERSRTKANSISLGNGWLSNAFLMLDRLVLDDRISLSMDDSVIEAILLEEKFVEITGGPAPLGVPLVRNAVSDYRVAGGLERLGAATDEVTGRKPVIEGLTLSNAESKRPSYVQVLRRSRNPINSAWIRKYYEDRCQICGTQLRVSLDGTSSDAAHVRPIGVPHLGPDRIDNMMCLCPHDHRRFDNGGIWLEEIGSNLTPKTSIRGLRLNRRIDFVDGHNFDVAHAAWHRANIAETGT